MFRQHALFHWPPTTFPYVSPPYSLFLLLPLMWSHSSPLSLLFLPLLLLFLAAGQMKQYSPPFNEFVSPSPSIEEMREIVVGQFKRPTIAKGFTTNGVSISLRSLPSLSLLLSPRRLSKDGTTCVTSSLASSLLARGLRAQKGRKTGRLILTKC